ASAWWARSQSSAPSTRVNAACSSLTCAMRPNVLSTHNVDRLDDAHAGICLESRGRRNAETYSAVLFRSSARRQSLRSAGNRHQQPTPIEPLGSPLGIFHCHCVDKGSSALDIVDPKVVDLDLGELRRDLA